MKDPESIPTPKIKLTPEQTLVLRYQTARVRGKEQYARADAAQAELVAKVGVGVPVVMPDGRRFAVKDQFAGAKSVKKLVFFDGLALEEIK